MNFSEYVIHLFFTNFENSSVTWAVTNEKPHQYPYKGCNRSAKKLHILKRFQQNFKNVCSKNKMNKMQLKLSGFLAYKMRIQMTEHKPSCFDSDRSFTF